MNHDTTLPAHSPAARAAILVFAVGAYAGFLSAFLYLVGFVHGVVVPTSLDVGPPPDDPWLAIVVDVGLILLFGVQHDVMARPAFKRWWTQIVPAPAERSVFVMATVVVLALMFTLWRPLPGVVWEFDAPVVVVALHVLAAAGWALVLVSTFLIDHFALFGLRQAWCFARDRASPAPTFVLRGVYRAIRHPLMTGFLVAFWSTPRMSAGHLLFAATFTAWVVFALRLEERDLVAEHGAAYLAYRRGVPGLIPRLGRRA